MKICFIGVGIMGETMLSGLLSTGAVTARDVYACDISPERLAAVGKKYGVNCASDPRKAVQGVNVIVLSVKPQALAGVLQELRTTVQPDQLALSIVAGASIHKISLGLEHDSVVRAMPNTPAQIGSGITVWTSSKTVGEEQRNMAQKILSSLGKERFVADEKYLDMATAVSGSGPAYVFLFMEALTDAGVHIGMPREMAKDLVAETVLGSARMAEETGKHLAELKNMVTSPGGTTAEGLMKLEEGALRAVLAQAVIAAYDRAKLLGDESNK